MEIINLLIIEDTASDIQSYEDVIRTFNMENKSVQIQANYEKTKDAGLKTLEAMKDNLHGAFIDLKLQTGAAVDVNEGNEIIEKIYKKMRFPIIVMTNTPGAFDRKFKESEFLRLLTKTDVEYNQVLNQLVQTYKTGITKILGKKGLIEKMLDDIFWNNISNSLSEWNDLNNSEKPLLRYILTHLQEYLEIADDGTKFDHFYPVENYIFPSIKQYFFTGDIVKNKTDSTRHVILTPACDLAPHGENSIPKTKDVLLVELQSFVQSVLNEKVINSKKQPSERFTQTQIDSARIELSKIISNNFSPKYYYLPNTKNIDGGLINFQKLVTVKVDKLKTDYSKEATISVQFVKDIVAKFSFYYSRQGSPDFEYDKITDKHII